MSTVLLPMHALRIPYAALIKFVLALIIVGMHAQACFARNYGLLIGVSDYQSPLIKDLSAQPNDLRLMWDALRRRGFAKRDLTVLADASMAPGTEVPDVVGMPTAANILSALEDLQRQAAQGDLIVFYFSGHGGTIPQFNTQAGIGYIEVNGYDEVLLPIDAAGRWDPQKGVWPNGILDDTLKLHFDALKKKAFLWIIIDACYSGGMTRGPLENGSAVAHFHDGQPPDARVNAPAFSRGAATGLLQPDLGHSDNEWVPKRDQSGAVAFLAAGEHQLAYEDTIPTQPGKKFSIFTYNLVSALEARVPTTYAQLAESVTLSLLSGQVVTTQTPVFEGDLNQPLLQRKWKRQLLWPARRLQSDGFLHVDAGQLQGIRKGAVLGLVSAGSEVRSATVTTSSLTQSIAKISTADSKAVTAKDISAPLLVHIQKSPMSFMLRVAMPPAADLESHPSSQAGFAAIQRLASEAEGTLPIDWTSPQATDVDIRLRVLDGVIYFIPPRRPLVRSGAGRRPSSSVTIASDITTTAASLRETLWKILRQKNLLQIAGYAQRSALYDSVDVRIKVMRNPEQFRRVIKTEEQECQDDTSASDKIEAEFTIAEASKLTLTHCDQIEVQVTNRWPNDIDVTLLYLDSNYGIHAVNYDVDDSRVAADTEYDPKVFRPPITLATWLKDENGQGHYASIGIERLLVIIAEAGSVRRTFHYLEQASLQDAQQAARLAATRAGAESQFDALVRQAGLTAQSTRGALDSTGDATMKVFQWQVLPPAQLATIGPDSKQPDPKQKGTDHIRGAFRR